MVISMNYKISMYFGYISTIKIDKLYLKAKEIHRFILRNDWLLIVFLSHIPVRKLERHCHSCISHNIFVAMHFSY